VTPAPPTPPQAGTLTPCCGTHVPCSADAAAYKLLDKMWNKGLLLSLHVPTLFVVLIPYFGQADPRTPIIGHAAVFPC